jgi:hypothetical protein
MLLNFCKDVDAISVWKRDPKACVWEPEETLAILHFPNGESISIQVQFYVKMVYVMFGFAEPDPGMVYHTESGLCLVMCGWESLGWSGVEHGDEINPDFCTRLHQRYRSYGDWRILEKPQHKIFCQWLKALDRLRVPGGLSVTK